MPSVDRWLDRNDQLDIRDMIYAYVMEKPSKSKNYLLLEEFSYIMDIKPQQK